MIADSIPNGYKQTEVGVIPNDWECANFAEVTDLITCGIAATPKYVPETQGYPFLSSFNVKDGRIIWKGYKWIDSKLHKHLYRNNPPLKGDLLYSRVGTIGEAAVINVDFEFSIYVSLTLIKPKGCLEANFLKQLLNSSPYKRRAHDQVYLGSGVGNLNVDVVRRYPIIVPPIAEQQAIAEVLSDAEAWIDSLEQVIAKKRQLKQAAMQKLLTGKKRLPGFGGEWRMRQLGELAIFHKGKGLPKSALDQSGTEKCIHYGELFTKYPETIREVFSRTGLTGDFVRSVANDVLMPTSDVTPSGLAKASCITFDGIILGGDILIIRPDSDLLCGSFLSYVIRHAENQVLQLITGTTVYHLYGSDMKNFIFLQPPIAEQQAIVELLDDMDADIKALEAKLEKARQIKHGMMQELLTGKTRLIKREQAA